MFLDDELLELCKNAECDTPDQIQQLNVDVCEKCENYYKPKITPVSTTQEIKVILDRTFKLFDSFVNRAKKSDDIKLQILGGMFEKFNFKRQFLSDEEMNRIYNELQ